MKRRIPLLIVVATAAIALPLVGQAATSGAALTNPKHFFWAPGQFQDPVSSLWSNEAFDAGKDGCVVSR